MFMYPNITLTVRQCHVAAKCLKYKPECDMCFVSEKCLTTIIMEDVGEAVQDAVTTATVGASFLNPLTMRNHPTGPIGSSKKCKLLCRKTHTITEQVWSAVNTVLTNLLGCDDIFCIF